MSKVAATPKHRPFVRHYSGIISLILLVAGLLVMWGSSLRDAYIPGNFSYSADVAVTGHDYDMANHRYSGSRFSVGNYYVQEMGIVEGLATLRGSIDVTSVQGRHVGKVTRTYTADTATGRYVDVSQPDAGFVFAPRGLRKGQSFRYQHILYPAVATMQYGGEEMIDGLDAYRYSATYPRNDAVPIGDITNASLPKGQELLASPKVTIWVEPQTGWLLKYRETSTVYVADASTHAYVTPLYHFTASFTDASVHQQAQYAKDLRLQLSVGRQVIPGILLVIALVVIGALTMRRFSRWPVPVIGSLALVLAVALASLLSWFVHVPVLNTWLQRNGVLNPLVSVCFIFVVMSSALLYRSRWRWLALFEAGFVTVAGAVQTLGNLHLINYWPDLVLFHADLVQTNGALMTRMSLVASFLFTILGAALLKSLLTPRGSVVRFVRMAAGIVFAMAVVGLCTKLLGLERSLDLSASVSVSSVEWLLFLLTSIILFRILQERHGHAVDARSIVKSLLLQSVVALPVIVIGIFAQLQQQAVERQLQATFTANTAAISQVLRSQLTTYTNMLVAVRTLFAASIVVEQSEWQQYISALNIDENYPGVESIGYIKHTDSTGLNTVVAGAQKDGINDYTLFPAGNRQTYDPVLYVEPMTTAHSKALGYDMSTDNVRNEAMNIARDHGTPTLSDTTSLLQETGTPSRGFLIFVPVYHNGLPTSTIAERRAALDGYVYAVFNASLTIRTMLSGHTNTIDSTVYDSIQTDSSSLLYSTASLKQRNERSGQAAATDSLSALTKTETVYANNHPWTLQFAAKPGFAADSSDQRAPALLWVFGSGVYLLLVLLFYSGQTIRRYTVRAIRSSGRRNE